MATGTATRIDQGVRALDELAILLVTSPSEIPNPPQGETVIITTKDAYHWAVLFSDLVMHDRDDPDWFIARFREVILERKDMLKLQYQTLGAEPAGTTATAVFAEVAAACGLDPEALFDRANAAFTSLIEKGLIVDPFRKKIAAMVLCVLGILPTGFTSTTDKGGKTVREVHAVVWKYEHSEDHGDQRTNVEFRLLKLIRVLQPKILEAYDEIIEGDEPGSQENEDPAQPDNPTHGSKSPGSGPGKHS
jgi:hypothetical protein